jgi:hypothetical protein
VKAKESGRLSDLSIRNLPSTFKSTYQANKKTIFNILILKEMLKSLASMLEAKAKLDSILRAYENACSEDAALEAAFSITSS